MATSKDGLFMPFVKADMYDRLMPNRTAHSDCLTPDSLMNCANMANVLYKRTFSVKKKFAYRQQVLSRMIDQAPPDRDSPHMKLKLGDLLKRRKMSQTALADAVGVNKSFISELVSGKKTPSLKTQRAIAAALEVDIGQIFASERSIWVVGRVGAGSHVELVDAYSKGDGLYEIRCPDDLPSDSTVAVEVDGMSMAPLIRPHDILIFSRSFLGVDESAINRVAICGTRDGRALVKHIKPGRDPGTFDLFSFNSDHSGPEYGVELAWAAPYRRHLQAKDIEII